MGELIVMGRQTSSIRRYMSAGESAEILFFTGVRYMRMPDASSPLANVTQKPRASKPRRTSRKSSDAKSA